MPLLKLSAMPLRLFHLVVVGTCSLSHESACSHGADIKLSRPERKCRDFLNIYLPTYTYKECTLSLAEASVLLASFCVYIPAKTGNRGWRTVNESVVSIIYYNTILATILLQ